MKHTAPLTALLERRSGRIATLRLNDGQELTVPTHLLPRGVIEGDTVYLHLLSATQEQSTQVEFAQALLEEILNGETEN